MGWVKSIHPTQRWPLLWGKYEYLRALKDCLNRNASPWFVVISSIISKSIFYWCKIFSSSDSIQKYLRNEPHNGNNWSLLSNKMLSKLNNTLLQILDHFDASIPRNSTRIPSSIPCSEDEESLIFKQSSLRTVCRIIFSSFIMFQSEDWKCLPMIRKYFEFPCNFVFWIGRWSKSIT